MWLLIRWIKNKDKKYIWLWIAFLIFSLIMWFSRIMVWVHRPTDIIWGFLIGIIIPLILSRNCVYKILKKILIDPLIKLQKLIIKR
jgi:membrane-associated phospholipid phosphatase